MLGMLCVCQGACETAPRGAPAAASNMELNAVQARQVRRVMLDSAMGIVDTGPPIELLPPSGIRWSDLPAAVSQAGKHPTVMLAVSGTSAGGPDTMTFDLLSPEGFPGIMHATRRPEGVVLRVSMGPYPDEPWAQARASRLVEHTLASLHQLGKVPRVPAYEAADQVPMKGYEAKSKPGARAR